MNTIAAKVITIRRTIHAKIMAGAFAGAIIGITLGIGVDMLTGVNINVCAAARTPLAEFPVLTTWTLE